MSVARALFFLLAFSYQPFGRSQELNPRSLDPNDPRCLEVDLGFCTKASLDAGGLLDEIKTCEDAITQATAVYDFSKSAELSSPSVLERLGGSLNNLLHGYAAYRGSQLAAQQLSGITQTVDKLAQQKNRLEDLKRFYEKAIDAIDHPGERRAMASKLGAIRRNLDDVGAKLSKIAELRAQFPGEKTIDGLLSKAVRSQPSMQQVQNEVRARIAQLEQMDKRLSRGKKLAGIRSKTIAAIRSEIRQLRWVDDSVTKMIASPSQAKVFRRMQQAIKNSARYLRTRNELLFSTLDKMASAEEHTIYRYMRKSMMKNTLGRAAGAVAGGLFGIVIGEALFPDTVEAPGSENTKDLYTRSPTAMFDALRKGEVKPVQICNYATDPVFADSLDQIVAVVSDYGLASGKLKSPLPQLSRLLAEAPAKSPDRILFESEFDLQDGPGPSVGGGSASQ